jgi:hypothetical protein
VFSSFIHFKLINLPLFICFYFMTFLWTTSLGKSCYCLGL